MKVSIVVPVRNDFRIKQCLDSLMLLNYPKKMYEIIVIDNNSISNVETIIKKFPAIYARESKIGVSFARNRGIQMAKGEIVAFTDADCVVDSNWIAKIISAFDKDSSIGQVGGRIRKSKPKTWVQKGAEDLAKQQLSLQHLTFSPMPYVAGANSAIRKDVFMKNGLYDTTLGTGEDVDMSWRIWLSGYKIITVKNAIVYHMPRDRITAYFKQFFGYSLGHVLLFKKYKYKLKKNYFINTYPLEELGQLFKSTMLFLIGKEKISKKQLFLTLIKDLAIISGNIIGSFKYRILFL